MMIARSLFSRGYVGRYGSRAFSISAPRREIRDIKELPDRIYPKYQETRHHDLLCLQWPSPPRNVLLSKKNGAADVTASLLEFANHIHTSYPSTNIILEPHAAVELHESIPFPIYTTGVDSGSEPSVQLPDKVDLISTLGGDGTILRASSLFGCSSSVPPVLSFGMGTLGFLGEWKFKEYKRAFREVYMSGAADAYGALNREQAIQPISNTGWSSVRGKSMGSHRSARVLLRNRLKVGVFDPKGQNIAADPSSPLSSSGPLAEALKQTEEQQQQQHHHHHHHQCQQNQATADCPIYALNEVVVHRGVSPHLVYIEIYIGGRFLTEAVADGLIVSSPTGSTAYSLSSGGSIVHPLVPSLLLTPICPRSLSFRPLVLPANTPITLRLSESNRGRELEVSVDGVRMERGVSTGWEVRVVGEEVQGRRAETGDKGEREWSGGVPSVVRGTVGMENEGEDHWVGGLNALLKFNYSFGEET